MVINLKGRKILKEPLYDKFRELLVDEIIKTIDLEGKYGSELRPIIEKTLRKEKFKEMVDKLMKSLAKETKIDDKYSRDALSILIEEDVARDIKNDLEDQIEERYDVKRDKESERLYREGINNNLWDRVPSRYLGQKTSLLRDVLLLIKENEAIKLTLFLGIVFLVISSILFNSVYHAIIAGLTLSAVPGDSVTIMIANILGAFGGILIFFVSLSLIFQHILLTKTRDEKIRELAHKYLERKLKK